MRFRNQFYHGFPVWLTSGQSEKVLYSLGLIQDMFAERMRLGNEARFPDFAPDDALIRLGRDRYIMRGIGESRESYSARLIRYLEDLRVAGSPYALLEHVFHYVQTPGATLRTVDDHGTWFERAPDGERTAWIGKDWNWDGKKQFRFWLIIVNGPWSFRWNPSLGVKHGTTSASTEEVASIMSLIRMWSPAGTQCEWVIVANGDPSEIFTPGASTNPDGTWGDPAYGNPLRPSRSGAARYWRGPR